MEKFIFTRHTERADGVSGRGLEEGEEISSEYPAITKRGLEKAREVARKDYRKIIDDSSSNGVIFLGGSSEEERTKNTAEIIGDELKQLYKGDESVIVFNKNDVEMIVREESAEKSYRELIMEKVEENQNRKVVFVYPLFLKQISLRPSFRKKESGEHTDFSNEILKGVGQDENLAAEKFIESDGKIINEKGEVLEIETLKGLVEMQIQAFRRLQDFAKKFIGDREISVGIIGHGWKLDSLAIYLANNGEISVEAFRRLFDGNSINQSETGILKINEKEINFEYRNRRYPVLEGSI